MERVWHNRSHLEAVPHGAYEPSPEDKAGRSARSRMSRNSPCLGWFAGRDTLRDVSLSEVKTPVCGARMSGGQKESL